MKFIVLTFALAAILADTPVSAADNLLYNATSAMLRVSSPIQLSIVSLKNPARILTTLKLPNATDAKISGTTKSVPEGTLSSLMIDYDQSMTGSNSSQFSSVKLKLEMTLFTNISYWTVSSMTADYSATVSGVPYQAKDQKIEVAPVSGFTHSMVDMNCQRGYTSCAPNGLSWTCDGQQFRSAKVNGTDAKGKEGFAALLVFPGLELQPMGGNNSNTGRFGYNWDCDPLISSPLWASLLIGLGLIVVLFWSCDMISSVYTPDRFDDPKGKPIMVPNSE